MVSSRFYHLLYPVSGYAKNRLMILKLQKFWTESILSPFVLRCSDTGLSQNIR